MKKAFYLILLLSLPFGKAGTVYAQQGKNLVDSLQTVLAKAKKDTNKVNTFNALSRQFTLIGNYDTALIYAGKAKTLAERLNFQKGIATAYKNTGLVYEGRRNYPKALEKDFTALKIYETIKDEEGVAACYNNIGIVYQYQGNYPEALKNYFAALKINEAVGNKKWMAFNYNNIGGIYDNQGNYPEALKNFFAALKIYETTGDKNGIADCYVSVGGIYVHQGNYEEALKNYTAAFKIYETIGDKGGIANYYLNTGSIYGGQGNYPDALKNYLSALKIYEATGDKTGIATCYNNMGVAYYYQGNYPDALKNYLSAFKIYEAIQDKQYFGYYTNIGLVYVKLHHAAEGKVWIKKGLALSKEIGAKEYIRDAYRRLSSADSALGNYKGAFENHKMYMLYKDSLKNEENTKKLTQTAMQYEFDKKQLSDSLRNRELQSIAKGKLQKQKTYTFSGAGIILLLLLFLVFIFRSSKKLSAEKQKSENLLLNILPAEVADELKEKGNAQARQFDEVSVLFTDFVHFTQTAEKLNPQQLVQELNECFTAFDNIMERNGLEKIKTIGDAYLAVCGLPLSNPQHAQKAVQAALEIRDFIEERKTFDIRIGIHSGSVVAGIVGIKKFVYDIWGDTVNTAARIEQNSEAGKINISETTYELVKEDFDCTCRGKVNAKGKGEIDMYFVERTV